MKKFLKILICGFVLWGYSVAEATRADVTASSANGFQIKHVCTVKVEQAVAFKKFVQDFNCWYDVNHSYSLNAANLSIDLDRRCMLELLPNGGFVRHMEVVFYQPGKSLRMTGGLGPLQGMGVYGALTFDFQPSTDIPGATQVTLMYNVSGADFMELEKIAAPVDTVLGMQLAAFQKYANQ